MLVSTQRLGHCTFRCCVTVAPGAECGGGAVQPADRVVEAVQTASAPLGSLFRTVRLPEGWFHITVDGAGGQCRDNLMKTKRALSVKTTCCSRQGSLKAESDGLFWTWLSGVYVILLGRKVVLSSLCPTVACTDNTGHHPAGYILLWGLSCKILQVLKGDISCWYY